MRRWSIACLSLGSLLGLACGDSGSQTSDTGFETGPCIEGQCFTGLACYAGFCVNPNGPGTGNPTGNSAGNSTGSPTGSSTDDLTGAPTSGGPGGDPTGNTTADPTDTNSTGSSLTESSSTGDPVSTTDSTKFDLGVMPDAGTVECVNCALTIASKQSGTLAITGNNVFATAQLQGQTVYALGTAGSGRFIATADSSLPFNEQTECPILEWLAGGPDPNPTLFWFGWGPSDGPQGWSYPGDSSGIHLPPQYVGNPAQLAMDYDIVMYLEGSGQYDMGDQPTNLEMQTLVEFVTIYGGGAYISSEFAGYLQPADYASINRALQPLGVEALAVNLNWGNVDGQIDFTCFPAPAG